ncbi:class I SAM-dependent methyltransferase [Pseudemcibacter aquimaris]|uniref:class I SAM-dependent methyltransferase n=1 Tax=Pseudemcibacter aquimaris TaxID=2857064 RepID=UPI0020125B8B|nr:methyltransferase domain-containing protein [Pseudemcibacter aquimaris]MCC3862145.1 methyltransferase domain-containing protein [Pseudemcibacter aquimaris]WDU58898.1 methyltransferase domain-containing protein [Pseudemcibacter aquimaris]
MNNKILKSLLICATAGLISGANAFAQTGDANIDAALNNPNRMESNSSRDDARKPGDVIKFMGVEAGDTVLDMVSNGGYYAEILAGVVGENGRVIAHMFPNAGMDPDNEYAAYIRKSKHMNNVIPIYASFNSLDVKENSLDYVFLIQNFHDFYFDRFDVDVDRILAMYKKALKPGGVMAVIDHQAVEGAPSTTGTTVHRIDSAIVVREMEKAGFNFAGELDVLKNTTDDPTKSVFDPAVRGKTSRFVMKFTNP